MTDYAGNSASFPATVRMLDDGQNRNATTNAAEIEDLADRTAFLKANGSDRLPSFASAAVRSLPGDAVPVGFPNGWMRQNDHTWTETTTDLEQLAWTFVPPKDAIITAIYFSVKGGAGHSALPANLPSVELHKCMYFADGSGIDVIWTKTDPSATKEDYEALHNILQTGLSLSLEGSGYGPENGFLALVINNEYGANAEVGLSVGRPRIAFTSTEIDRW